MTSDSCNSILKGHLGRISGTLLIALWLSLLFLPFKGPGATAVFFLAVAAAVFLFRYMLDLRKSLEAKLPSFNMAEFLSRRRAYAGVLFLLVLLALPLFAGDYLLDVAILAGIYIILALGLNVVVGFAGLLNLGFAAFYAIGAYAYALLNVKLGIGFWPALPVSLLLTTLGGFLLAIPALRLRGDYLAIVTLGFGEITRLILNNWDSLTRGPNGISGIARPEILSTSFSGISSFYYLVFFLAVVTVFLIQRVRASRIGRAWIAIREDEVASSVMGINNTAYKLYAFAFGAFWAGLAGSLFAAKMQFVSPESFTFMESVLIVCMVILGGLGSIAGVVVGAFILIVLPEMLREAQLYRMLALGAGLVILMIFRPQGLLGGRGVSLRS
ncbi:MAG: branched-chain amino acid ABC transporter permease [Nitrospirota bacterium]